MKLWEGLKEGLEKAKDIIVNTGNNVVIGVTTVLVPPPEKDMFQVNGQLSPDEFKRAGNHLIKQCNAWQWKDAVNVNLRSKYLQ